METAITIRDQQAPSGFSLPMRDGNSYSGKNFFGRNGFSLPMRDGNFAY